MTPSITKRCVVGFRYNAAAQYSNTNDQDRYAQRFSISYVTGSHNFKTGVQLQQHVHNQDYSANGDVNYVFNAGVPTRITQRATPFMTNHRTKADLGIFAQDQWAIRRLTLNYGLRFDYYNAYVPAQYAPAGQFVGERSFEKVTGVPEWTDLNPRLGASYDLFGNGRTALKASFARYVGRETTVYSRANNPLTTSVNQANRAWNDANGNFVPDCDLINFAGNGECGPIDNVNFGKTNPRAVQYADDLLRGFGVRDYFWDFAAEVQHELRQGVSVKGGYYRNWSDHFGQLPRGEDTVGVIDNLAIGPEDFDPFCLMAPVDPRLPGGGGFEVCGLYDIKPAKFGVGDLLVTRASNYGDGKRRQSDFFTGSVRTRLARGLELSASVDTGRTLEDLCFVVDSPQSLLHCKRITPFSGQTDIKINGVFPLPGGIVVSAIFENLSGANYAADYQVSNAQIAPSLGRSLAACGTRAVCTATVTVPLIAPRTVFNDRRNLLDLRLTKIFSLGSGKRLRANFDIYNVMNEASVLVPNNNYGAFWRQQAAASPGGSWSPACSSSVLN